MIDPRAIALIKEFEGCRLTAYLDSVHVWTIGWGTTAAADVGIVPYEGLTISQADADMYLQRALEKFAALLEPMISHPNSSEFGAFLSLAYNIGPAAFGASTARRQFNAGNKQAAADAIRLWNKAGGHILPGLVRRREAERTLFLSPPPAATPVPTLEERIAELEAWRTRVEAKFLSA